MGSVVAALLAAVAAVAGTVITNRNGQNVANQNIAFQQKENEISREREDNAVQRRALDLQKAGLSKTLAAGSPASASSLQAPKNEFVPKSVSDTISKLNLVDMVNTSRNLAEQVQKNRAERRLIESESAKNNILNSHLEDEFVMKKAMHTADIGIKESQKNLLNAQLDLSKIEGQYKAQLCQAQVGEIVSRIRLNDKNVEKVCWDIAESIVRRNHLKESSKKLVAESAILQYNLKYAEKNNLPVGQQLSGGLVGGAWNVSKNISAYIDNEVRPAFSSLWNGVKNLFRN